MKLFVVYRQVTIRDSEVVQGVLLPDLEADDHRVRDALAEWEGTHFLHQTTHGTELTLVRRTTPPRRERWWLHLILAAVTLFTTTLAGSYFAGRNPLRMVPFSIADWFLPIPVGIDPGDLVPGLTFSVPLFLILLGHEMGHYLVARKHRMDVSPPYFIPSPNWVNLIGTFGAFIRLRSPVINKPMLLDVGVAGPLASFFISLPALALGFAWSQPVSPGLVELPSRYVVLLGAQPIWLGDSLIVNLMSRLFGSADPITLLHPVAFAGWLGLFVTALNLFPLAQLDGGHILYALLGPTQRYAGIVFLGVLAVLGNWWWGWWFWALVILVVGRGNIRHPPVFDPTFPISGKRILLGWGCVLVFFLSFVPVPLQL